MGQKVTGPPREIQAPPKISKKPSPRKTCHFKIISAHPYFQWGSYSDTICLCFCKGDNFKRYLVKEMGRPIWESIHGQCKS